MACKIDVDTSDNTLQTESGGKEVRRTCSSDVGVSKTSSDGPYKDPVYKKLSRLNGEVNRLNREELRKKLSSIGLDTRGHKEVLRKRLKNYYRRKKLLQANLHPPSVKMYDYIAVIDFEATCDENNQDYEHEIIEFPVVLIDMDTLEIVSKFREYVKPVVNPVLTPFCTKLTGIKQSDVDKADTFPIVLEKVQDWMRQHNLGVRHSFAVLTDGPWDMYRFMYQQCEISQLDMPKWAKRWINVRKAYHSFYKSQKGGLDAMLENLGMEFEGNPHCGLDDSTNIARIAIRLLKDGCALQINEYIDIQGASSSGRRPRYEPVRDESALDGEDVRQLSPEPTDSQGKDGKTGSGKSLEEQMKRMCFKTTQEQQEEYVDDLITYFQSRKSPKT